MNKKDVDTLLEARKSLYGETWLIVGSILLDKGKTIYNSTLFKETPYAHNWIMLLSKLCRALHSPSHIDSWKDIMGYCQLIIDDIEKRYS
jgi:hypothetical protein